MYVCMNIRRDQTGILDVLDLDLQVVVSHLMQVLETKLGSSPFVKHQTKLNDILILEEMFTIGR